ncbi:hypothetical protein DPM19_15025 [Actinomadura craniellae]|uniref:GerMN domain-containing protein n=1 Tax=Actinomadura craniellae TaxID=2231787 RepID=A0A365H5B3_9ACTN|nr:LpqB family beta-propeller domain-containing protein [Actinomadura craniellae]RAY14287.1 hypothetical protein DPM19_15025 [Actinomadura craniellae]
MSRPGHGRGRRPGRLFALVTVLACAAGCAGVPTGGRVASGPPAERVEQVDDPYVRIVPVRPGADWEPVDIVRGFLIASASFDDGHRVARAYLAPGTEWQPEARPGVTVYEDSVDVVATEPGATQVSVAVRGSQVGAIGRDGQYEADARPIDQTFHLSRDARGQWRISGLPEQLTDGLLLSRRDVDRAFRTLNLYFFAPDGNVVVPNPVFLPLVNRQDLARQLVRALLGGPTSWLQPAVKTTFPAGTRLLGDGVQVSDGVAVVDLSAEARTGDRRRMSAQLMWTLRQLPEVRQMRIQIDGETVRPDGAGPTQSPRDWIGYSPDASTPETPQPAFLRGPDARLHRLGEDASQPVGDTVHRPAVSLDAGFVAGLDEDGRQVLAGPVRAGATTLRGTLVASRPRSRFTTPTWDRNGALWVVESDSEGSWLWVKESGREWARVERWGLGGYEVLAMRIARDGVRVAALVKDGERAQIQLGRIAREPAGRVMGENFLPVSSDVVNARDLFWYDSGTLAVLGTTAADTQVFPYLVPVSGGMITPIGIGALGDPVSITAAPDSPVLVGSIRRDAQGRQRAHICRQRNPDERSSEWLCTVPGSDPAYPG